ncbi:hypothetical protein KAX03_01315 [Candidatus Bathyarchaeota archaeon]|nr:hypothetical protein [Candidatus Bathyarchaeota archaeon]
MLKYTTGKSKKDGVEEIQVSTDFGNDAANKLYEKTVLLKDWSFLKRKFNFI